MSEINKPLSLLERSVGGKILVRLKGNRSLRGTLEAYDSHLNLIIEKAEELLENGSKELGRTIVRGDNVILVSPPPLNNKTKPQ
ncbi:MAG: LSM domain-containing protein [Candidatus Hodarchaeota archaeon]